MYLSAVAYVSFKVFGIKHVDFGPVVFYVREGRYQSICCKDITDFFHMPKEVARGPTGCGGYNGVTVP